MKQLSSTEWIAHFLASDPPRSKSLVMTIFGDTVGPHGGTLWLGSLIELAAPFGVNDRLLRTSVFRLAQEGWLVANRDRRRSSYSILPQALPRFERANRRIYAPLEIHWDGSWTLVMAAGGSIDAPVRAALRKELLWEGYAQLAPGVFGHPASDGTVVAEGWDLSEVRAGYEQFIDRFSPLLALQPGAALDPEHAFVIRTLLIHAYRRVQLHDPMLPVELLPGPWPGARAYELARTLYRTVYAAAEQQVMAAMRKEDAQSPAADATFYQRFGGLE